MYKWYRKSTKCYVYMPDVSVEDCGDVPPGVSEWQSAFRSSMWFTRGWTLQELIAPAKVEFFSAEGSWLGDKSSLEQPIHEITGVPPGGLRGNVSRFGVEERLLWAANRQTTVEEDTAYCLLGIVDVHMPLIYGEGRNKAMARLQRELHPLSEPISGLRSSIAQATGEAPSGSRRTSRPQTPAREVMQWEGRSNTTTMKHSLIMARISTIAVISRDGVPVSQCRRCTKRYVQLVTQPLALPGMEQ